MNPCFKCGWFKQKRLCHWRSGMLELCLCPHLPNPNPVKKNLVWGWQHQDERQCWQVRRNEECDHFTPAPPPLPKGANQDTA